MFVYVTMPLDFWEGWMSEETFMQNVSCGLDEYGPRNENKWSVHGVLNFVKEAEKTAKLLGWEGDIRQGPYFSVLPPNDGGLGPGIVMAWKQDNNGTTFIASEFSLPHLEDGGNFISR